MAQEIQRENEQISKVDREKDQQEKEKKDSKIKKKKGVTFWKLQFSLAKKFDILIILLGTIGSLASGISMPLFIVIFGRTLNDLGPSHQGETNGFLSNISTLCLQFVWIGLGMFGAGWLMISAWTYNGKVLSQRIKKRYFQVLMLQEQAYFDQCNSYEFATKIQSQTKQIENGVNIFLF
jgi:ATP-binding cassette subfamily B (MDR/TAP) protein 1